MYSVQPPPPPAGNASVASISTDVIPAGYTAIYTVEDLNNVRNKLDGKYILMNDIDLSSIDNWNPIGEYIDDNDYSIAISNAFKGTFDGNGHVIKNLSINRPDEDYIGLFGCTYDATIKNLGQENVDVIGQYTVGGLIGQTESGTISNCYVTGNVSGKGGVGGLIGVDISRTVSNCYSSANVSGIEFIGGLVGLGESISINNCYTSGNVSGNNVVGGLVGLGESISINNCYISGNVYGNTKTGLIAGDTSANYSNVWADKKNSNLDAFGKTYSGLTITNSGVIEHSEFTSHEFWDNQNLDSDVWEMSNSIPPILKNVGGLQGNWYFKRGDNETRLQVGEGSDPTANALFINSGLDLGAMQIDLSTVEGCLDAVNCVKGALDAVTQKTADIGIAQSRLETISDVNTTKIENLTAAYATVTEADVAEEVANFTKSQILAQTAASLITQTQNFHANMVLRMIGSLG